MITQNHKIATSPAAGLPRAPAEKDAAVWANLLDDFLGPENDVYSRLLQTTGKKKSKLS